MPSVLFLLFHDFTSNSAYHVHSLANHLVDLGWICAVAVPQAKSTINGIGSAPKYRYYAFGDLPRLDLRPDILHCWTPREVVRVFYQRMPNLHRAPLVIHLEDNEWEIASRFLKRPFDELAKLPLKELDSIVLPTLSHPVRGPQFLQDAAGVTVVLEKLTELAPAGKPAVTLWPSAEEELFGPRPIDWDQRRALGIPDGDTVIVYSGNVHDANTSAMGSLYLSVALLNREGHRTTLVRTGRNFAAFPGGDEDWARRHAIELGFVERKQLPGILSMANVFVQPGKPGAFNDYRFPSKVPEFCAIGRPLILPASNVGLAMRHREDAYVLPRATAAAIAEAVLEIRGDTSLEAGLTAGSQRFFTHQLSWRRNAARLADFYQMLLAAERNHRTLVGG